MIIDKTGSLAGVKRHDYLPFGEELGLVSGRTTTQGYSPVENQADNVRQKFTSKERDNETGLDYFPARYYSSTQGRFTSPDEFTGGPDELFDFAENASDNPTFYAELDNPQSLNKYQYTFNNPLRYVDPDGHGILAAVAAVAVEVGGTVVDVVTTVKTLRDPKASTMEKVLTTSGTVASIFLPGGGYGTMAKGVLRLAAKRERVAATKADDPNVPAEAYDRKKHYGSTPTKGDRKATGGESTDHDPPLVQRYYEGDPKKREKTGFKQPPKSDEQVRRIEAVCDLLRNMSNHSREEGCQATLSRTRKSMNSNSYTTRIRVHYEEFWHNRARVMRWTKGPIHELPESFSMLLFQPTESRRMWTYGTCGMSLQKDPEPLELHLFAPETNDEIVELFTAIAHYHRTANFLGDGDTVNFGRPWMPGSACEYGLISLPYLDGPDLEWMTDDKLKVRFLWLIPITQAELEFKKKHGLEALEKELETARFDYLDPTRASVV